MSRPHAHRDPLLAGYLLQMRLAVLPCLLLSQVPLTMAGPSLLLLLLLLLPPGRQRLL